MALRRAAMCFCCDAQRSFGVTGEPPSFAAALLQQDDADQPPQELSWTTPKGTKGKSTGTSTKAAPQSTPQQQPQRAPPLSQQQEQEQEQQQVLELLHERQEARRNRDFTAADEIRDQLKEHWGVTINGYWPDEVWQTADGRSGTNTVMCCRRRCCYMYCWGRCCYCQASAQFDIVPVTSCL
jgi:hypothetical protein